MFIVKITISRRNQPSVRLESPQLASLKRAYDWRTEIVDRLVAEGLDRHYGLDPMKAWVHGGGLEAELTIEAVAETVASPIEAIATILAHRALNLVA